MAPNLLPPMNPLDDLSPEELSALECTARSAKLETQTFVAKISYTAGLLNALPAAPAVPSLVFRHPVTNATECVSIDAGLTVGRGEGCEVCFEGRQELSRRHFTVRAVGALFFVEDLASSNGTIVEGVEGRIARRELRDGDLIRAGGIVFLFVKGD